MRSPMPATARDPRQPDMYSTLSQGPAASGGAFGWWLRLSAPPEDPDDTSLPLSVRERLRRGRLASAIIPGIFVLGLLLLATTIDQTSSKVAVAAVLVASIAAIALNRIGQTTVAGYLLVLVLVAAVMFVFISAGSNFGLDYFPVYDLLIIPLVVASAVLPRQQIWLIAIVNTAFVVLDVVLQRPSGVHLSSADGQSLVAKPIVLQFVVAIVAYLWARSMDRALRRADRAEEIAKLEHEIAEQKRQLDMGVQQILQTHIRVANGDYSARAPMDQSNVLWQIASSLNNLVSRLQRSGQAEFQLQRTNQELQRLREALIQARSGRQPIWPAPTGTAVDEVLEVIVGPSRPLPPPGTGRSGPGMTSPF